MRQRGKRLYIIGALLILLIILTSVLLIVINTRLYSSSAGETAGGGKSGYDRHYILIAGDDAGPLWDSVYEGARAVGEETGVYVEYFGKSLSVDYDKEDLLKIAVYSDVDGIILEGDKKTSMARLVGEAVNAGIPVVTVLTDCLGTTRQSYVGINSYKLGQEYGMQILEHAKEDTSKVMVLMSSSDQNTIYTSIYETIAKSGRPLKLEAVNIDDNAPFGAEEKIRDIFMDTAGLPDILICLDADYTTSAYQAAVDYNKVGQLDIIGYYASDAILNAIERGVISATVTIDARQMGERAAEALNEYITMKHVSDYITVDTNLITADNVRKEVPADE